ncbi:MAG: oligosaccharyl transferase, archaeosortase A system-associated [Chloroflexi bacterium]|nr:oligosaccharyl transferase, archaeosortase A system-associated [Chloroflexota bacterium]
MMIRRLPPWLLVGIFLMVAIGVALYFRIVLPYDQVFAGDQIKFTSNDAYYHMRIVDSLASNFPRLITFDPYIAYPSPGYHDTYRFFDWLLAGVIWVIGLGSPTQHLVDMVSVYFPAVLGALVVIPVYFIGRELFNRWVGIIAAGLMAVMPGEFLGRSILGFTDHHVAENLFSTTVMLFLILAIKTGRQAGLSLAHFRERRWDTLTRPLVFSVLAGTMLGLYFITWLGGLLFVFIIAVFLVVQSIIEHLRQRRIDYLGITGAVIFAVTTLIVAWFNPPAFHKVALVIAIAIPPVLALLSRLVGWRRLKPYYYPAALAVAGLAGIGLLAAINRPVLETMLGQFKVFMPTGASLTTLEMQRLLFPQGSFTTVLAWGNFGTGLFLLPGAPIPGLGLIAMGILVYLVFKQDIPGKNALLIWSLVILAATLGQRRFAYYFATNMALLSAYISWHALRLAGFRAPAGGARPLPGQSPKKSDHYAVLGVARDASQKEVRKAYLSLTGSQAVQVDSSKLENIKRAYALLSDPRRRSSYDRSISTVTSRKKKSGEGLLNSRYPVMAVGVIIVFFVVFFPNISQAREVASEARFAPTDGWVSSLTWMKENTPEPFNDPDYYYRSYSPGDGKSSSSSVYGVASWWDYGYWITRIAHRVPNANPGQSPNRVIPIANLFLSQEEPESWEIMRELGSAYVVIDYPMAIGKFWAIVTWAGLDVSDFIDVYHVRDGQTLKPTRIFSEEYYRSLLVRLYNFDGKAVTPEKTRVISWEEVMTAEGVEVRQIVGAQEFTSYEKAVEYIKSRESGNYRIVGENPFASPVPLEAVTKYRLAHGSAASVGLSGNSSTSEVKIFEYLR